VWTRPCGPVHVHQSAFDCCVDIADNDPLTRVVGRRLIDMQESHVHYVGLINSPLGPALGSVV
jgi:hypothetical protein